MAKLRYGDAGDGASTTGRSLLAVHAKPLPAVPSVSAETVISAGVIKCDMQLQKPQT